MQCSVIGQPWSEQAEESSGPRERGLEFATKVRKKQVKEHGIIPVASLTPSPVAASNNMSRPLKKML